MAEVIVVGAGLAGLVCAQQLQQAGLAVTVVEKSRGLGGRVATRRIAETCADHGLRYLDRQGELSHCFIQALRDANLLNVWTNQIHRPVNDTLEPLPHQPYYVAPAGMTTIAKALATGLSIQRNQRVIEIAVASNRKWNLTVEAADLSRSTVSATAIVLAMPAPQSLTLLQPLADHGLESNYIAAIASVEFDPCFSAIATYPASRLAELAQLPWGAVEFSSHPDLSWVSIDSRKRLNSSLPLVVIQSSASFAKQHLETTEVQTLGQKLVGAAAQALLPWFSQPDLLQVHRWRYAFVSHPLPHSALSTSIPLPLVCSGDWCGGNQLESALQSGLAAAQQTATLLQRPVTTNFSDWVRSLF